MSKEYYPPENRYKITLYLKNGNNVSGNLNNAGLFLTKITKKRFCKWIVMPTNDKTPDLFVRRSEIAFVAVETAKSE